MEESEIRGQSPSRSSDTSKDVSIASTAPRRAPGSPQEVSPAYAGSPPCLTCGSEATHASSSYVYAIGRIEARFPRPSVEKEFAQATGRADTIGKTDHQAFHAVLSK